jgi:CPA2 family monovalent cation:H+ antiporter-2
MVPPMTHDLPVLRELVLLAGCSLAIILLFRRFRMPPVVGFLVTGILLGPGGFGLIRDPATISTLAEIGVVLLLFTVGLEFSIADLRKLGARAALAGLLQVVGTAAVVALVLLMAGAHPARAIFFGLLLAPSSTALVFRLITDRGELQAPYGKLVTAILLVQDLAVVPMAMLIPTLGAWTSGGATASWLWRTREGRAPPDRRGRLPRSAKSRAVAARARLARALARDFPRGGRAGRARLGVLVRASGAVARSGRVPRGADSC